MKTLNYLFSILFTLGNLLVSGASFVSNSKASVVSVGDGDTIRVNQVSKMITS